MHVHACCHVISKNYATFLSPTQTPLCDERDKHGVAEDMHKGQCVYPVAYMPPPLPTAIDNIVCG